MAADKKMLGNAIDILMRSTFPEEFEGSKLYGDTKEDGKEEPLGGRFFRLSNETGTGRISVYQVFTGIELYYNDMHMAYCNQNQTTIKNSIEINHCAVGRYECSFGENSCCYMAAGDLSIGSLMRKKSDSSFPLNHYHGITIIINLEELLPEIRQIMELLNIDLSHIQQYICEENRCCIMRANASIEHIFSELYHVRGQRKLGYMRVKVLELLLFLSDLETDAQVSQMDYYNQNQVRMAKEVKEYITKDLSVHYTIEALAGIFHISPTMLKRCFKGVFGTSIYSYLRIYRLQVAQKMLMSTQLPITMIANRVGYENPNKFTSAFGKVYGMSPKEFRKNVQLDRKELGGGEEQANSV